MNQGADVCFSGSSMAVVMGLLGTLCSTIAYLFKLLMDDRARERKEKEFYRDIAFQATDLAHEAKETLRRTLPGISPP
jgi:hypothetical protein